MKGRCDSRTVNEGYLTLRVDVSQRSDHPPALANSRAWRGRSAWGSATTCLTSLTSPPPPARLSAYHPLPSLQKSWPSSSISNVNHTFYSSFYLVRSPILLPYCPSHGSLHSSPCTLILHLQLPLLLFTKALDAFILYSIFYSLPTSSHVTFASRVRTSLDEPSLTCAAMADRPHFSPPPPCRQHPCSLQPP